jgi:hypothetical protein
LNQFSKHFYYPRVELWGVDPWVSGVKPVREDRIQESFVVPQYYAQHLLPYTRYKLKVLALNSNNLYNSKMPLELSGKLCALFSHTTIDFYL